MAAKRILVINDTHCGHLVGLTPPAFNPKFKSANKQKLSDDRAVYWNFFSDTVESLRPIDAVFHVGDAIDGKGEASGGTEQLTTDRNEQCSMGVEVMKFVKASASFMVCGTPYHVGREEDWEKQIADEVGARISSHEWVDVNGLVFDLKHHVSGSQTPQGRHTAMARERLWNVLWAEHGEYPKSHVLLRGHVHYHNYCGGYQWLAMTLPALQGYGSKFGARRMSGTVDFGLTFFEVESKDEYTWQSFIAKPGKLRKFAIPVK